MFQLFGAVAKFERAPIHERQQEGINLAKKCRGYKGWATIAEDNIAKAKELYDLGGRDPSITGQPL